MSSSKSAALFDYLCSAIILCTFIFLFMKHTYLLILSLLFFIASCTSYVKDPTDDDPRTELLLSAQECELSSSKRYTEISIHNGSGKYYVLPMDLSIAWPTIEGNVIRILGVQAGDTFIKVVDEDDTDYRGTVIKVRVKETIERMSEAAKILFIKKGELRLLSPSFSTKDCEWRVKDKTIASLASAPTGYFLQGNQLGKTSLFISKEYWDIQEYQIQVVEQYTLQANSLPFNGTLREGLEVAAFLIKSGNGQYAVEAEDASIITASVHDYQGEYDDTMSNPAFVWLKILKAGRTRLTVNDLTSGQKVSFQVSINMN